jgi:hypothetical protein
VDGSARFLMIICDADRAQHRRWNDELALLLVKVEQAVVGTADVAGGSY